MNFDKEIYPSDMQDRLEEAVINSAENCVKERIAEKEMSCDDCGSEDLEAEVRNMEGEEYSQKAVCADCGEEKEIEVKLDDLRSAPVL